MAAEKKATVKPVEKAVEAVVKEAVSKVEEKKAAAPETEEKKAVQAEAAAEAAPVEKKRRGRKPGTKNAVKAVEKTVEKVAEKTAARTAAKKKEFTSEVHVQFGGKSYSQEDLVKIAKDVWKFDLKQKAGDLESLKLYVKPEENIVYYVMNKEFTGSFYI